VETTIEHRSSGAQVPLGDVAEISIVSAPNSLKREGGSKRIDVTCNVEGRDLGSAAVELLPKNGDIWIGVEARQHGGRSLCLKTDR